MDDKDEKLREIHREIASAVVISKDGKFFLVAKILLKEGSTLAHGTSQGAELKKVKALTTPSSANWVRRS